MPRISCIIVTYNSAKVIRECIASVTRTAKGVPYEIFVVDNNSSDDIRTVIAELQETVPHLTLVANRANVGYGSALNIGVARAKGEYVMFLNPDVSFRNDVLTTLVKALDADRMLTLVAPALYHANGAVQRSVWQRFPSPLTIFFEATMVSGLFRRLGVAHFPYLYAPDPKAVAHPRALSGSCMVMRKDRFEEIGGFDERFFLYYEETDLCRRILARYPDSLAYVPAAHAAHRERESTSERSAMLFRRSLAGMSLYLEKYYSPVSRAVFWVALRIASLALWVALTVLGALTKLPGGLQERRAQYAALILRGNTQ